MKFFIGIFSIFLVGSYAQEQKDGYLITDIEEMKFFINIHDPMTQDEAFAFCHERGYELINFESREKQFLVTDFLLKNVHQFLRYWTAGKRVGNSDSFLWNTGDRLHVTDSFPLPDHKEKNCVALVQIPRKLETYELHTEHCHATNPVICERTYYDE